MVIFWPVSTYGLNTQHWTDTLLKCDSRTVSLVDICLFRDWFEVRG